LTAIDAFETATRSAVEASRQPLPPEYPADQVRFVITFSYYEDPPAATRPPVKPTDASSLLHATVAQVEARIGKPQSARGAMQRYAGADGDLVLVFDEGRVMVVDPPGFELALLKR
jgi:hypothetical protein